MPRRTRAALLWAGGVLIAVTMTLVAVRAVAAEVTEQGLHIVDPVTSPDDSRSYLVVTAHGWIDGGKSRWAGYTAEAIAQKVDSSKWACAYFDWTKGAFTLDPKDAAEYARDTAGPQLAAEILAMRTDWCHVHLIGHSCGAWVISEAAKILRRKTGADIHLTFLDAYVPEGWDANSLGAMPAGPGEYWAEQYFTRDATGKVTEARLKHAVNIDITEVDPLLKDHNFPKYWYYMTVTGEYPHLWLRWCARGDSVGGVRFGFCRSLEADPNGLLPILRNAQPQSPDSHHP